eukprot:gene31638-39857_t
MHHRSEESHRRVTDVFVGREGVFSSEDFYVVDRHLHAAITTLRETVRTDRDLSLALSDPVGRNAWHRIERILEASKFTTNLLAKRYAWIVILDMCTDSIAPFLYERCCSDKVAHWLRTMPEDLTQLLQQNSARACREADGTET